MLHDPNEIPSSTPEAVRKIANAIAAEDYKGASQLGELFLSHGLVHPAMYSARALWFERQGKDDEALAEFQRARALSPKDAMLLNAIGLCLTRLYRLPDALEIFDEAIRIDPAYAPSHQRKGVALGMAGLSRAAEDAHRRAVSLQPRNPESLGSLASIAARKGDVAAAERYAERALAADKENGTAHAALALVELSRKQFPEAEQRLRKILRDPRVAGHGRAVAMGLLGDALDAQGEFAEAFAAFEAANREMRRLHAARFHGKVAMSDMLEGLSAWFESTPPEAWEPPLEVADEGGPAKQHVFLLGFYRSGTTLLEQVLETHPGIITMEERDLLAEDAEQFLTSAAGLERLSSLDGPALALARSRYWEGVRRHGIDVTGRIFVDKHPLNSIKLPLIRKLFPHAKIVFALRDPRDVVLSCFRRHFEINAAMFEFLSLEGAARLYDRAMAFADQCRRKIAFRIFEHRYEDMVLDFETAIRAVCDFLEAEFLPQLRDFATTARGLDIRSPSAPQVRRGLYSDALAQWTRYRSEMEPVLPSLERWVERFGYTPTGASNEPSAA
ncbi:MAG: tetratricopeptide repeat-containing sulfotransferase family protein [Rhizomicrobium sp.]